MFDPTDSHPLLTLSRPAAAEASAGTQRRRLLMLARGAAFQMQAHLSRSGGGMQGVLARQLAQQGVNRVETQLAQNSDAQTLALTRFLQRITQAVSASDSSDEQFIAAFEDAWSEIAAAVNDDAGE